MIAVSAAERLGNDFVDDFEFEQIGGCEFQGLGSGGFGFFGRFFPENAGAAFSTDDRIVGKLQNANVIADADAQRAANRLRQ